MMSKEDTEKGTLCRGICSKCDDRFGCYQSNYKPTEDEQFAFDSYEKYSKEVIILAMCNYQQEHVKKSNEAYGYKKELIHLTDFLKNEISKSEESVTNQSNDLMKNLFIGQKMALERILREISMIKIKEIETESEVKQ